MIFNLLQLWRGRTFLFFLFFLFSLLSPLSELMILSDQKKRVWLVIIRSTTEGLEWDFGWFQRCTYWTVRWWGRCSQRRRWGHTLPGCKRCCPRLQTSPFPGQSSTRSGCKEKGEDEDDVLKPPHTNMWLLQLPQGHPCVWKKSMCVNPIRARRCSRTTHTCSASTHIYTIALVHEIDRQ